MVDRLVEISDLHQGPGQLCSVTGLVAAGLGGVVEDGLPEPDGLSGRAKFRLTHRLEHGDLRVAAGPRPGRVGLVRAAVQLTAGGGDGRAERHLVAQLRVRDGLPLRDEGVQRRGGLVTGGVRGACDKLQELSVAYAHHAGLPASLAFDIWPDVIEALLRLGSEVPEPVPVIIDEFPNLVAQTPALPSVIQIALSPRSHASGTFPVKTRSTRDILWWIQAKGVAVGRT